MKYYPKNRIRSDQFTSGGELVLEKQDYAGAYYLTFDGRVYTGKNPYVPGANRTLSYVALPLNIQPSLEPVPHYPNPTNLDYKRGYIIRYFLKKRNEKIGIMEISKPVFDRYENKSPEVDHFLYQVTDVFWKITGPLRDDRTNRQYPIAGIIDTNKRIVKSKETAFPGLVNYIGENYTKYNRGSRLS